MMRRCREYDIAFGLLEEGIRTIETTGERMFEAELYRLLGELELEVRDRERFLSCFAMPQGRIFRLPHLEHISRARQSGTATSGP